VNRSSKSVRVKAVLGLLLSSIAVSLALVSSAGTASAHRNDESYLYLDVGDDDLRGTVQMPYGDIRRVLGLRLAGTDEEVRAEIATNLALLQRYAAERTSIGADGVAWDVAFDGFSLLSDEEVTEEGLGYVILPFIADLGGGAVPQLIELEFTPFLAEIPDRNNIGLISNYWEAGFIGQEANELVVFSSGSTTGVIDLSGASQWKNFRASMDLGVDHIRTGPDHIFFILVLLLPVVLILVAGVWYPAPSFARSLWKVFVVATMFTIAHSITFTLAGLDILPLPPAKLTETLIALSIAVAALHNLKPIFGDREWVIAFGFGLFHGMGFAAFVDDLEISRTTQLVSLLGRNLGIELGQLVIILVSLPALYILSRTRFYRPFFVATMVVLAAVSLVWVVERLFEEEFGINRFVDAAIQWPRSLWFTLVFTMLTGAIYLWERANGRLLAVGAPATDGEVPAAVDLDVDEPVPAP
jgi:hypothetical protein